MNVIATPLEYTALCPVTVIQTFRSGVSVKAAFLDLTERRHKIYTVQLYMITFDRLSNVIYPREWRKQYSSTAAMPHTRFFVFAAKQCKTVMKVKYFQLHKC